MPRKKGTDKHAEIEVPEPAEAPAEELIVVEYQGDDEETLYAQLDEARGRLAENGVLYLAVDKAAIPHQQVTQYLTANFRSLGALNVGTNPKLQSNDFRNRAGWMCLK
jgi:hypothetical protein